MWDNSVPFSHKKILQTFYEYWKIFEWIQSNDLPMSHFFSYAKIIKQAMFWMINGSEMADIQVIPFIILVFVTNKVVPRTIYPHHQQLLNKTGLGVSWLFHSSCNFSISPFESALYALSFAVHHCSIITSTNSTPPFNIQLFTKRIFLNTTAAWGFQSRTILALDFLRLQ